MTIYPKTAYAAGLDALFPCYYYQQGDVKWNTSPLLERIQIKTYAPRIGAAVGWLPTVEARIRRSLPPSGYEAEETTEWLSGDAANAALSFFDIAADLLPSEPHIYGTHSGDLVAEFETDTVNLTAVISFDQVLLFLVKAGRGSQPEQRVIQRTSKMRESVRAFAREHNLQPHGSLVSPR